MIEVFKYIVEPRFNMQRDWGNVLVKWRVRYIEHLYITNAWEMLYRGIVSNPDLKNFV